MIRKRYQAMEKCYLAEQLAYLQAIKNLLAKSAKLAAHQENVWIVHLVG